MRKHCCEEMQIRVEYKCDIHEDPFDCPDNLIKYCEQFDEYGLIVHDGGTAYITIEFCPWCGKKLPESKRDLWFDTLEKMGYENPLIEEVPVEFETDEWYKNVIDDLRIGLKGRRNIAQGNALGKRNPNKKDALKGQDKDGTIISTNIYSYRFQHQRTSSFYSTGDGI